jgi:hypothetical protein
MKPIEFPEQNVVFAKNQPEYLPLPAHVTPEGEVITCWQFSWRERFRILFAGVIWWRQLTFHSPLQPQSPTVESPFGPVRQDQEQDQESGAGVQPCQ